MAMGYGITGHVELTGTLGINMPYNYGREYIAAATTTQYKVRYMPEPYFNVNITYRPNEKINFFVQGSLDLDNTDYNDRTVTNYKNVSFSKYEYKDYSIYMGGEVLF